MSNSRIVYSTDNGSYRDDELTDIHHPKPSQQKVRLHLDRRGGGKIVTVIKGLVHEDEIMVNLTKELKKDAELEVHSKKIRYLYKAISAT